MKELIARRLAELKEEFEAGQKMLAELDEKRERLKESMLRIAGAVQVLEELESTPASAQGRVEKTAQDHAAKDVGGPAERGDQG